MRVSCAQRNSKNVTSTGELAGGAAHFLPPEALPVPLAGPSSLRLLLLKKVQCMGAAIRHSHKGSKPERAATAKQAVMAVGRRSGARPKERNEDVHNP